MPETPAPGDVAHRPLAYLTCVGEQTLAQIEAPLREIEPQGLVR